MTTIPAIKIGQTVAYVGTQGKQKAAIVLGTPETIEEGTSLPALLPGQLHLAVWTWSAMHFTPRLNVPFGEAVDGANTTNQAGQEVGTWQLA